MSMHMGVPCTPLVKVGDCVKVGEKIGDCDAPFSVPIHSSVSGKVTAISDYRNAMGAVCKAVEIETDGKQEIHENIAPPVITDRESFINAVRESGVCGLGGAGFPTHIKLNPKNEIDTLIINAAECEPYITSDYREMLENTKDILNGIEFIKNILGIKNVVALIVSLVLHLRLTHILHIHIGIAHIGLEEGKEVLVLKGEVHRSRYALGHGRHVLCAILTLK
jgi:electron transport complex protein RnfC